MVAIGLKQPAIRIVLDTPTVNLFGERAASAGFVLSGRVVADFKTATKVRSIEVSLLGAYTVNVMLPKTQNRRTAQYTTYKKDLISNTQMIVEGKSGPIQYPAGRQEYHFEFVLPGDLPATVQLNNNGQIGYSIRSKLVLTGLRSNCEVTIPVIVARCPGEGSEWSNAAFDTLSMEAKWENKLKVTLMRESRAVPAGGPANFIISVEPSVKRMQIISFDLRLRETQSVFRGVEHKLISKKARIVAQNRIYFNNDSGILTGPTDYTVALDMPEAYTKLQYDHESGWATVKHHAILIALIRTPTGTMIEMEIPTRVSVLPDVSLGEASNLPLYESSHNDMLIQAAPINSRMSNQIITCQTAKDASVLPSYSPPKYSERDSYNIHSPEYRKIATQITRSSSNTSIMNMCLRIQSSFIR